MKESLKRKLVKPNGPELVAFFNQRLDLNRFLIEDSDGNKGAADMPKVEFGAKTDGPSTGFDDNTDPFEEALDDALCVFKSGDGNSDILERNEKSRARRIERRW